MMTLAVVCLLLIVCHAGVALRALDTLRPVCDSAGLPCADGHRHAADMPLTYRDLQRVQNTALGCPCWFETVF